MWKKEVAFQHTVIILLMNCVVQDSRIRIWWCVMEKISGKTISAAVDRCIPIKIINARFAERKEGISSMNDTEYRERCRELEKKYTYVRIWSQCIKQWMWKVVGFKRKEVEIVCRCLLVGIIRYLWKKHKLIWRKKFQTIGKSQEQKNRR